MEKLDVHVLHAKILTSYVMKMLKFISIEGDLFLVISIGHVTEIDQTLCDVYNTYSNSSTHVHEIYNQDFDRMIHEAVGVEFSINYDEQNEDFPNTEAQKFYDLLHV